jgi:hypothetical protein
MHALAFETITVFHGWVGWVSFLVLFLLWSALMPVTTVFSALMLLIPLPFAATYDLWLRLKWKPEIVRKTPSEFMREENRHF